MWKSTGWVARHEAVTRETIHNWIKTKKYERVKRTKGGHYRIWINPDPSTILYARVSSSKQRSSIDTQRQQLTAAYPNEQFIFDIASGFNQNRRAYRAILEQAINGYPLHIVATTQDRITRTGFTLIKWIVELSGGRIELLEENCSPEQFDTTTLIAFITSFINSHYGKRSAARRKSSKENKDLSRK